jgi:hypothetical protein
MMYIILKIHFLEKEQVFDKIIGCKIQKIENCSLHEWSKAASLFEDSMFLFF